MGSLVSRSGLEGDGFVVDCVFPLTTGLGDTSLSPGFGGSILGDASAFLLEAALGFVAPSTGLGLLAEEGSSFEDALVG